MYDAQEQHLSEKHGMMTNGICIDNGWAWHLDIYDEETKQMAVQQSRRNARQHMQDTRNQ